jgi:hypothetical protein
MKMNQTAVKTFFAFFLATMLTGRAGPSADVTAAVQGQVKDNSLAITVWSDVLGDPAPGVVKKLKVEYTVNGVAAFKIVMDKGTLRLDVPKEKKLVITKATYGDLPDTNINVEENINAAIKDNKVTITINADSFGGDPAFGIHKSLEVWYMVGDKVHEVTGAEGEALTLPQESDGAGKLVIIKATYGAN